MKSEDWPAVRSIYQAGIETGHATFETEAPDWIAWNDAHLEAGRIVARQAEQVVGWETITPISSRCVYAGVAEVSVYVAANSRLKGVGRQLLMALVAQSEEAGLWTLQAGIFPENEASLALHRVCGFRQVGRREKISQLAGRWRDVIIMERRSQNF